MLAQHPVHRALALLFYMNALVHCDISIQQHPIINVEDMDVVGQPSSEEMAVRYPGKDAIINAPCSRNRKPEYDSELSLPSNVCLTWDPKMDKDILIHHPGFCPGGTKVPYLALYSTADCTGEHTQPGWYATNRHGIPYSMNMPHCLSNALFPSDKNLAIDTKHKSMILRCGDTQVQGADEVRKINIPTPKATQKPAAPKPKVPETASVSDSACYVSGLGPPRFLFQSPAADTCLDISPKRQLKIYRPAMCPNGTQSLLAKFAGPGCRGSPKILKEVTDNMLKSCIEMQNADGASSYAFWCSGNLKAGVEVPRTLFPDQNGDQVRVAYCYGNGCNRLPSKASKASGLKTSKASGRLGPTSSMATWLAPSLLLFFLL